MPDIDPIRQNAEAVSERADALRPADSLGMAAPRDAVVVLPNPILAHERDADGNSTYIKLGG